MKTFYFNNSCLRDLSCTRKYSLIYDHGLKTAKSDALLIGTAFHHYMKVIGPEDQLATLLLFPNKKVSDKLAAILSSPQLTRLADLALRATALLPKAPHVKEQFFSFDSTHLLTAAELAGPVSAGLKVNTSGTIDRAERMTLPYVGETLVLTDYKTTHKPLNSGDLHLDYSLQSQFPFYAIGLILAHAAGQLPPAFAQFADLIEARRIAVRYLFANHTDKAAENGNDLFLEPPRLLADTELQQFASLIGERRQLAAFIQASPELARKDGIINGTCWACPFKSLCALRNEEKEKEAIAGWPLGRAEYDPTHQSDET